MKRLTPKNRKNQLKEIAISIALRTNYRDITLNEISKLGNVSRALVVNYFKTVPKLKETVMREAIARGIVEIVAQGLGVRDPVAIKAPTQLKQKALALLAQ